MTTSPYNRESRDAIASKLFIQAFAGATGLGAMTVEEQTAIYDQAADISLLAANRFLDRSLNTTL